MRGPVAADEHVTTSTSGAVRRDIQGLRAVAVILVLLFHLWPGRVPGGYVGVDVFFVISGFLITGHLLGDSPRSLRHVAEFWGRRVRRLLPASLLVIAVTVALAIAFLPVSQLRNVVRDAIGSTIYIVNWVLATNSVDYLGSQSAPSPLQHYWSLAVEEQFYLVWPLLVAGTALAMTRRRAGFRRVLMGAFGAFTALSLAASVIWTAIQPASAYFVTPTRLWELAAGGLIATWITMRPHGFGNAALRRVLAWSGLVLIGIAAFAFDKGTPFPGVAALLPVAGAVLFLLADGDAVRFSPSAVLSWRPIQFTGDISYSLYLWHWPLVVIAPYVLTSIPDLGTKAVILVASFTLAALSKRFVEDPVRRASRLRPLRRTFALMAVGMVLVTAVSLLPLLRIDGAVREAAATQEQAEVENEGCFGSAALSNDGCSLRGTGIIPSPAVAIDDRSDAYSDGCFSFAPFTEIATCSYGTHDDPAFRVALIGNSHAAQWLPALQDVVRAEGAELTTFIGSRCSPTESAIAFDTTADTAGCTDWGRRVVQQTAGRFDLVVFTAASEADLVGMAGLDQFDAKTDGYVPPLQAYADAQQQVLLIRDTPIPGFSVPDCVAQHATELDACDGTRNTWVPADPLVAAAERVDDDVIHVVDFSNRFCDPTRCFSVVGGVLVYFDALHVSATYISTVAPYLRSEINAVGP